MSAALLDVNVLVALFDPVHVNHEEAHLWFGRNRHQNWATCPLTVNSFVRVLSNPAYPSALPTAAEAISRLRKLCSAKDHQSWDHNVSLLDDNLFHSTMIAGHQKITDIYLLGLAVRRKGKLATFDRSIPLKSVNGAEARHLEGARQGSLTTLDVNHDHDGFTISSTPASICDFIGQSFALAGTARLGCEDARFQQVAEADPAKKFGADTVRDGIDHFRTILCRVDVHAERPLAKGRVDHLDDSVRDRRDIRIGRHDGGEAF